MQDKIQRDASVVSTKYWEKLPNGRVRCNLCPNHCRLAEGQRGACFVRACLDDQIVLTTYGRSSGFCIDPIEKKPLHHFLPGSPVLSFGTAGCNLTCKFCQNWSISKSREVDTLCASATPEAITEAALRSGCHSIAFTYNDPVIFMEYAIDVAKACRPRGIKTVAVTAGYMCDEPRREFYRYMDAANVDLKAFTDNFYRGVCGADLENVLETLIYIKHETAVWLEITTLLIPGENDGDEEIEAMTKWIMKELGPEVPLHFTAFHPDYKMMDHPSTPPATLARARSIALRRGMKFVYTGNVRDAEGGATYCPACGKRVIGRDGYEITVWHVAEGGRCNFCGHPLAGHFESLPGDWGARRMPVRVG